MSLKDKKDRVDFSLLGTQRNSSERRAGAVVSTVADDAVPTVPNREPRTAIGLHAASIYGDSEIRRENDLLKQQVRVFEGALPVKHLDPLKVKGSKWANRMEESFASAEFRALEEEIVAAGGNVQPIKVRPIEGTDEFEVVFGHRRHRACRNAGLPVLAMIAPMDDASLFAEMDRENRERADLRPFEQGMQYARALEEKLFPSIRKMAEKLGVDASGVSRLIAMVDLPREILKAFASPLDIQFDWGNKLAIAHTASADRVLEEARRIADERERGVSIPAAKVFSRLVSASPTVAAAPTELTGTEGKAVVRYGRGGSAKIHITGLSKAKVAQLDGLISKFLESEG